jgi:hypothetical protein
MIRQGDEFELSFLGIGQERDLSKAQQVLNRFTSFGENSSKERIIGLLKGQKFTVIFEREKEDDLVKLVAGLRTCGLHLELRQGDEKLI